MELLELFGLNRTQLLRLCETLGHPSFRAKQIADWLYCKGAKSAEQMTNLPGPLREELTKTATLTRSEIIRETTSGDGTTKFLLRLSDGETIESVLLPYPDRISVCISTQVGCSAGCAFCATGDGGFVRNLTPGEIIDQVLTLQEKSEARISHVVLMGMGEPLLNLRNVLKSIHILNDEVGISMRRITLSTVGITPAINKLAKLDLQITLAVSLHAPNDELRKTLIPYAEKFPLNDLINACRSYANTTKRRVTFEYLLIAGVNDTPGHALELSKLLARTMCHVNVIPYNEIAGKLFKKPSRRSIDLFCRVLEQNGIEATQRLERGEDVSAACGQLKRGN